MVCGRNDEVDRLFFFFLRYRFALWGTSDGWLTTKPRAVSVSARVLEQTHIYEVQRPEECWRFKSWFWTQFCLRKSKITVWNILVPWVSLSCYWCLKLYQKWASCEWAVSLQVKRELIPMCHDPRRLDGACASYGKSCC